MTATAILAGCEKLCLGSQVKKYEIHQIFMMPKKLDIFSEVKEEWK